MTSAGQITGRSLQCWACATPPGPDPHDGLITAVPVANLYVQPSFETEVISQSIYGCTLQWLESRDEWIRVCADDAYPGWVLKSQLIPHVGPLSPLRVSQLTANLYREPDVKARAPLLQLPWEARLESLAGGGAAGGRWLEVRLLDGQTAFVQSGDVLLSPPSVSIEAMLTLAHRFLGITYTWGGTTTFGFDCSGFVQMLYRQRGIVLPRDAQAQCDWLGFLEIARADVEPGDLLFFTDSPPVVTHVGLSLGEGGFIHGTTEGHPGIQISRLDTHPWKTRLCALRRLRP